MRETWKKILLKDACKVFADGDWIESKDQSSDGIRLVQTGNIGFGYFKDKEDKSRFISEETFLRLKCTEILPGDLLVSRLPDPVGKSCIIPEINSKMITGVDCTIIRPNDNLSSEFLCYYQMSNQYLKDVQSGVSGATRQRISRKNLGLIEIPLPPISVQQSIVAILDDAFAAIDRAKANAEQNLKNAKELFESYLQGAFENKGEGWEEKTLGQLSERVSVGHVGPTSQFYCDPKVGVPFIRSQNVRSGNLDWKGIQYITKEFHQKLKKSQLKIGDILFVRVGANRGDCCILKENIVDLNCANIVFARLKEGNVDFIDRFCQSPIGRKQLLGMSVGAAQGVINTKSVAELIIPYPPIKEQQSIVDKIAILSAEIQKLEAIYQQKLNDLEELRKSVLQKAFNGELTGKKEIVA